jgi:hypothetical protein
MLYLGVGFYVILSADAIMRRKVQGEGVLPERSMPWLNSESTPSKSTFSLH